MSAKKRGRKQRMENRRNRPPWKLLPIMYGEAALMPFKSTIVIDEMDFSEGVVQMEFTHETLEYLAPKKRKARRRGCYK